MPASNEMKLDQNCTAGRYKRLIIDQMLSPAKHGQLLFCLYFCCFATKLISIRSEMDRHNFFKTDKWAIISGVSYHYKVRICISAD